MRLLEHFLGLDVPAEIGVQGAEDGEARGIFRVELDGLFEEPRRLKVTPELQVREAHEVELTGVGPLVLNRLPVRSDGLFELTAPVKFQAPCEEPVGFLTTTAGLLTAYRVREEAGDEEEYGPHD